MDILIKVVTPLTNGRTEDGKNAIYLDTYLSSIIFKEIVYYLLHKFVTPLQIGPMHLDFCYTSIPARMSYGPSCLCGDGNDTRWDYHLTMLVGEDYHPPAQRSPSTS